MAGEFCMLKRCLIYSKDKEYWLEHGHRRAVLPVNKRGKECGRKG